MSAENGKKCVPRWNGQEQEGVEAHLVWSRWAGNPAAPRVLSVQLCRLEMTE